MDNKGNLVSFQTLKRKYAFFALPEQELLQIYEEACQENAEDVSAVFYKLLLRYIQKNMSYEIMNAYLKKIGIDSQTSIAVIEKKLHSFFNFLDSVEYTLTLDDAICLLKEDSFQFLFMKKFKNKKEISFEFYESFVGDNANLELLCNLYMDEQNILVVESKNYSGSKSSSKLLSRSENIELAIKAQNGDSFAMEKMLKANSRLVYKIANYYVGFGLEYDDLVQEGMMGLMNAIAHFDSNKGCAFSTYAIWWVRQAIKRAIDNQVGVIRLPVHVVEKLYKIHGKERELKTLLGRNPTIYEIADHLQMPFEEVEKILDSEHTITSLQTKVSTDKDETELGDFIQDETIDVAQEAIDLYENSLLKQCAKEILNDREYQVIYYRFGLGNGSAMTLADVGKIIGVTRERVRQIEIKALKKLNCNRKIKSLRDDSVGAVFKKKEENNLSSFSTFDVKTIHPDMTMELFFNFIDFIPSYMKKAYCSYRSISLFQKCIYPKKVQEYDANYLSFMDYIESLLKEMLVYYKIRLNRKNILEIDKENKLWKHMERYSLFIKYREYTMKEIFTAVKKLPPARREVLFLRYGKTLREFHTFPDTKDSKYYSKVLAFAYHDLKKYLEHPEIVEKKEEREMSNLLELYTKEELMDILPKLSPKLQEVVYLRHGKNLDSLYAFPKNVSNSNHYYNSYSKAKKSIEKQIQLRKEKVEKKFISKLGDYTYEEVLFAMTKLEEEQRNRIHLKRGKYLDEYLAWPDDKPAKVYNKEYKEAICALKKILNPVYAKELEDQNKKRVVCSKTSILNEIERDVLVDIIPQLSKKLQEVVYLRHGKNLDAVYPYPAVPEGYSKNYYNVLYYNAKKQIQKIAKGELVKCERKSRIERKDSILKTISPSDLVWALQFLSFEEKECIYLRHTKSLNVILPWPEENRKKYYNLYNKTVRKIRSILSQRDTVAIEETKKVEPEIAEIEKKVSKRKEKKLKTLKQELERQNLVLQKAKLENEKIQNYMASLYEKYMNIYGKVLSTADLKLIIEDAVASYSFEEGLGFDLAVSKKVETSILLRLSNQYKENPDSEESLDILLLMEEIFGTRLKERYTHANYCYLSDEQISSAIEETFQNYTGRLPYYVELSLKIKKQGK